jgi:predicted phage terminase large subunit-like protein
VLLTSYGADLAIGFGRRVRDTILERQDILNVKLRKDAQRVNSFLTTGRGGMFAVGVGGPITGRGGDLFLIDDYVKNAKDANSETVRKDILDWFTSTAYTRLEPNASIIILATRWNIKDLIGALKSSPGSNNWLVIELSAIAEKGDPLGREVGEPLWPERYSLEALQGIKDTLGTYFWQSLYQQHPIPGGTNVANEGWFPIIDILPHRSRLRKVRFWDLGATADAGDYTSGTLMSEDVETGMYYIEDIRRFQKSPKKTEKAIKRMAELDNNIVADVKILIEQEPGSAGKTVVDHYVQTVLKGFVADGRRVTGDKFVRAQPFFAAAEAGKVRLLRGSWNQGFIDEILQFPDGDHDDQADSTSGAYNDLIFKRPRAGTWGRETKATGTQPTGQLVTGAVWGR